MDRRRRIVWLLLCAAGLLLCGWMLLHALSGVGLAGCSGGGGCDSVMRSPWGYVLGGVPVSLPALVVWLLLTLCIAFFSSDSSFDRFLWRLMRLLAGCLVGAALWFGYLQAFRLHAFCAFCTATHLLGCVMAACILFSPSRPSTAPIGESSRRALAWFTAGLAAAGLFAFVQTRTLPELPAVSGQVSVPLPSFSDADLPVLSLPLSAGTLPSSAGLTGGSPAPDTLTLLFDFQCSHCRSLHALLPELLSLSGGRYRIRLCPVPLSSACNPYVPASGIDRFRGSCTLTRHALAVWYARPEAALSYWDWLLGLGPEASSGGAVSGAAQARAVSPAEAEARARALLGADYESALADPRIADCLRRTYELFGRTSTAGSSAVPRFIAGDRWLQPAADSAADLLDALTAAFPL